MVRDIWVGLSLTLTILMCTALRDRSSLMLRAFPVVVKFTHFYWLGFRNVHCSQGLTICQHYAKTYLIQKNQGPNNQTGKNNEWVSFTFNSSVDQTHPGRPWDGASQILAQLVSLIRSRIRCLK